MAKQMTDPVQTNSLSFEGAADKKWFPYVTKSSQVCEVKFCDGSTKKYATGSGSNIKDVVVIGPGCKSSYSMGEIISITKGKTAYLVKPLISFSADPTKGAIQKCVKGICDIKSISDIIDLLPYDFDPLVYSDLVSSDVYEKFALSDIHILDFLYAATILAYPKLAGQEAVKVAQKILSGKFSVPNFMFESKMKKLSGESFVFINFSGFYPGWKDDFKKLSVFADCEALDPSSDLCEDNELLIFSFKSSSNIQRTFKEHPEFQEFYHQHIVRSALSLLIRGGFTNMLEAALSVKIPGIDGFYEQLARFAYDIGSIPCLEIIYGKRETFGVKSFENKLENDVAEPLAQWKEKQAKQEAERLAQSKAKPEADPNTEEITITYEKYKVKVTVQVKGDDRILAGKSLSSYPFLEKTTKRSWKIVEEKLIPDVIRNFDNGEVHFKTEYFNFYLSDAKGYWSKLSKHKIEFVTLKNAAHINELKYKPGYFIKKFPYKPTEKLLAEVETYITEHGPSFDDSVGEFLSLLNSVASMEFASVSSLVKKLPRKKNGSLSLYSSVKLPTASDYAFIDKDLLCSYIFIQSLVVISDCEIKLDLGYFSPKLDAIV